MDQIIDWFLNIGIAVCIFGTIALAIYHFADNNIFFMRVPEGEIVVVMFSERVERFVGKIDGYWVDPETGEVWKDGLEDLTKNQKPRKSNLPKSYYGIYWLGLWPFAKIYKYDFHWNKYTKKEGESEYSIVPRDETVCSLYFQATYPVRLIGAETSEGVPITADLLITVQTTNADYSLFKVKTPGWLASLTGSVTAVVRDLIGSQEIDKLPSLQLEHPKNGGQSELQLTIEKLNESSVGNPSIKSLYGQKIVSVNFLGYKIDQGTNDTQKDSIARWKAKKEAQAQVELQVGENAKTDTAARKIRELGKATGEALTYEATGLKAKADAVKDNPVYAQVALADAIKNQEHATTLIIGSSVVPTMEVNRK